jgi:hypothetical protein
MNSDTEFSAFVTSGSDSVGAMFGTILAKIDTEKVLDKLEEKCKKCLDEEYSPGCKPSSCRESVIIGTLPDKWYCTVKCSRKADGTIKIDERSCKKETK